MGWGTTYKYEGYISRVNKSQLYSELDEANNLIKMFRDEILGYMVATPPATGVIDEEGDGNRETWSEFVTRKLNGLWDELLSEHHKKIQIEQALEVQEEHPDDVYDS